ncbi:SpoIIE family protein phosphatase [Streptomyces scabiei]|uniref:SpoIIE family protein phosphatase n=3 Tax=Streptomyces scabiei TaxID=1930 RepID=UPI0004E65167|nr:SpoIIE family protein phosphatase [Streptomyces scabiei]KFG03066.1 PAS/PAC sensor protein [Streptomyces scabiei]MDX2836186.1 SpoIIE family protein phosphatase [Streptomyces scabiei]MDX3678739.1 SpoIIE family protein phosphatase [Streptomyces scabiei]
MYNEPDTTTAAPEDFAVVVDARGAVMVWSAGAERLLGHRPEDVVGRPASGLLGGTLPFATRRHLAAAEQWTSDLVLRKRDGHRVTARLRGTPLTDGDAGTYWVVTSVGVSYPAGPTEVESAELWGLTLAQLPLPVAIYDSEARFVTCNEVMTKAMGLRPDEMRGRTLWEIYPAPPLDEIDRLQHQVARTGEMVFREEQPFRASGEVRDHAWSVFLSPLKDRAGTVLGVSALVIDITEQYWARRRLAVINDAGVRIGSTLDVTRTAEELAEVAVSGFADFATVDLLESVVQGHEPQPVPPDTPVVCRRTAQRSVLTGCPESVVPTGDTDVYPPGSAPALTLISGRASHYSAGDASLRAWVTASPGRARSIRRFKIHSVLMVPLRARGVTLGVMHLMRHRTADAFGPDDLILAEEIAARAAVSIDNARRYTRERRTALTLQRSLLPERLPEVAAVDLAYRYLPAGPGDEIGGDWFDVIALSGGRVALAVGDVVGHGVRASATMGRLRSAVRTLADADFAPDELLTRLDELVIRLDREEGPDARRQAEEASGEVGATCLYAVYDPVAGRCDLARAGHPPPLLTDPDGTVRVLDLPAGPPLGLGGLPFEAARIDMAEGSVLALYTDGLIAAPGRDLDVGLDLLGEALRHPSAGLEETCEEVMRKVRPDPPADDIVLLLARTSLLGADQVRTWPLPADPAAVAGARRGASEQLAAWGLGELEFATELIVSELVTNAIRYGTPPIQLRLVRADALICEVSDGSATAPHLRRARTFDEGGRGLLLVAQVAERWGSRHTSAGKTIWAEQPLPADAREAAPVTAPPGPPGRVVG